MSRTLRWSGTFTGPVTTPMITSGQNKNGGLYQVNLYGAGNSEVAGTGHLLVYVSWTDRTTGLECSVNTSGVQVNFGFGNTVPVDAKAGTPIMAKVIEDTPPFAGVLTYNLQASIEQL